MPFGSTNSSKQKLALRVLKQQTKFDMLVHKNRRMTHPVLVSPSRFTTVFPRCTSPSRIDCIMWRRWVGANFLKKRKKKDRTTQRHAIVFSGLFFSTYLQTNHIPSTTSSFSSIYIYIYIFFLIYTEDIFN